MSGVLVDPNDMERVWRATLGRERTPTVIASESAKQSPIRRGLIRAILLEPLYGGWHALAQVCVREPDSRLVELQVVGASGGTDSWRLRIEGVPGTTGPVESLPFGTSASAADLYRALMSNLPLSDGDLFVSGGVVSGAEVPDTLKTDSQAEYTLARWWIAFSSDKFTVSTPVVSPIGSGSDAIIISSAATWRPTEEIIQVIEGGLNPDRVKISSSYGQSAISRYPLVAGSVVLADYCEGAGGYVVTSAEPRKFRIT